MAPVVDQVRAALARRGDIVAAWVFGSAARDCLRPDSDVDVAVLRGVPATGTVADLMHGVAATLQYAAGRAVDLVAVDDADPDLVHRVLREGILVLDRDRSTRIAFEVRMRNLYFDLLPQRTRIRQAAVLHARKAAP